MRWAFLTAIAFWIFHPFVTARFYGTGDALWYSNMLADFVLQWRAGVFPVFVGQTEYAFNGAVYPLRVAPLYQHVGGILDLVTARQLSFFALQHLVVISVGIAGMVSCYACLVATVPRRRWTAALLTTLYITCPGVLGIIFIQDLYMSWMTLPFLPLVVFGLVRSYSKDDVIAWMAMAVGLGGTWLAHAPIAMWMTAIAGATQLVRLLLVDRTSGAWKRATAGGLLLLALAQYPFVSTRLLQSPGAASPAGGVLDHPEKIVAALQSAFPGCLLPLSEGAGALSDLQLGYGLGLVLLLGVAGFFVKPKWNVGLLLITAGALILLLVPIPVWTETFWLKLAPEAVRRLTFYWPMHRLYLILATIIVFTGILAIELLVSSLRNAAGLLTGLLLVSCGWSLWETRQFQTAARARTASEEDTSRKNRPENRLLMAHAYGLFSKLPPYFSNGVIDPLAEFRFLDPKTQAPLPVKPDEAHQTAVAEGDFIGTLDANPGILNLAPALTLSPGKHYELEFTFGSRNYTGILQGVGTSFFREYSLPSSGEARAFGSTPGTSAVLPLWTTQETPESVVLRFIPTATGAAPLDYSRFAHFRLWERSESGAPVQVRNWIPLTLKVTVATPALLETPRMFTLGYQAIVNRKETLPIATPAGLLALPVPAGTSEIQLRFSGPPALRLSYWTTLLAWTTVGAAAGYIFISRRSFRN